MSVPQWRGAVSLPWWVCRCPRVLAALQRTTASPSSLSSDLFTHVLLLFWGPAPPGAPWYGAGKQDRSDAPSERLRELKPFMLL